MIRSPLSMTAGGSLMLAAILTASGNSAPADSPLIRLEAQRFVAENPTPVDRVLIFEDRAWQAWEVLRLPAGGRLELPIPAGTPGGWTLRVLTPTGAETAVSPAVPLELSGEPGAALWIGLEPGGSSLWVESAKSSAVAPSATQPLGTRRAPLGARPNTPRPPAAAATHVPWVKPRPQDQEDRPPSLEPVLPPI